jgi:hypothetical protein
VINGAAPDPSRFALHTRFASESVQYIFSCAAASPTSDPAKSDSKNKKTRAAQTNDLMGTPRENRRTNGE